MKTIEPVDGSHISSASRERSQHGPAQPEHDEAVLRAEVRRLVRALRPFGVLRRDVLEREACADTWHEGGFVRALHAAVRMGMIEPLPMGFYRFVGSGVQRGDVEERRGG